MSTIKRWRMGDKMAGADVLLSTSQRERITIVTSEPFQSDLVFIVVIKIVVVVRVVEVLLIEEAEWRDGGLQCFRRQ